MEIQIINRKENLLLERSEVEFKAIYAKEPTPTRKDLQEKLASVLNTERDLVVIAKLKPSYGKQETVGYAKAYKNKDRLVKVEPKYILTRGQQKEKKPKEKKSEKQVETKKPEEKKE